MNSNDTFDNLGLSPKMLQKLHSLGFSTPTPIQKEAIPVALDGRDIIGIAKTGTGKTLAFGVPILETLDGSEFALILAPTRELAQQIDDVFRSLGARPVLIVGGAGMDRQVSGLRSKPAIVVATPGRLLDHIARRTIDLKRAGIVVLDEADRMLDMGFIVSIRKILDLTAHDRQTLLFSATMPKQIADLAQNYLHEPVRLEMTPEGTPAEEVEQELMVIQNSEKSTALGHLLAKHKGTVLVFARTRHGARKLARTVRGFGHSAAELHSDRTLNQRREALSGFKGGQYRVLVATDIAARGIDVKEIALVVNYDVPEKPEDYVHRIGRTGRAGASGRAITLATPEQHGDVRDIERLLRQKLRRSELPKTFMA
jgi:ATP-dependent RNA helicase RhlE